jgi:hypothetical protein
MHDVVRAVKSEEKPIENLTAAGLFASNVWRQLVHERFRAGLEPFQRAARDTGFFAGLAKCGLERLLGFL